MSTNVCEPVRPRPLWQVLLIGAAVGAWLLLALLHLDIRYGRMALPITVSIETQRPLGPDDLKLGWEFRRGDVAPPRRGYTMHGVRVWRLRQAWIASLLLTGRPGTLDEIEKVTVEIGESDQSLRLDSWPALWTTGENDPSLGVPQGWEVRRMSANPARPYSVSTSFGGLLNYPGDARLLRRAVTHPVFITFLCVFALLLVARWRVLLRPVDAWVLDAVVAPHGQPPLATQCDTTVGGTGKMPVARGGSDTIRWCMAGLLVMAIAGVVVETFEPYYFTQDDNYSQFFPGMLYGCRTAFAGAFPAWNPHQFLGAPLAEVGTYALTYPLTYVSYALATYVLGDELATVEVFCWLHLAAGFVAFLWFGRRLGLAAPLSSAMALCFVLSGYALVAGRSWFYMVPTFLWAPLLGVSVQSLTRHKPGWCWLLGTGLVIGLDFHAGNAQM